MVDDVDDARDLLWDSLLPALRATRLHADPFHVPYPGAGGGPAPSVSTGFRSAIESPSAGRTWWQFTIVFLASDKAAFITGASFAADGGKTAA